MTKIKALTLCIATALSAATSAHASQSWVSGVDSSAGWLDYEKQQTTGDGDDMLCWAASTSCILDYWQSLYITSSTIPTGEKIWERYKEASTQDMGGNPVFALQWWLGGDYAGISLMDSDPSNDRAFRSISGNQPITTNLSQFGGYYWDFIPETHIGNSALGAKASHVENFIWYEIGNAQDFSSNLIAEINQAPISLALRDTSGKLAHAITLWGVEYTDGTISKVWITDSDDYQHTVRALETEYMEGNDFIYLKEYSNDTKYGDIYIFASYGINTEESDTWGLVRVPEPATAALAVFSILACCTRRRR